MKFATQTVSLLLIFVLVLSFAACGGKKEGESTSSDNLPDEKLSVEIKYSTDFSNWTPISDGNEMFKADGTYAAGETEIVYINVKNPSDKQVFYNIAIGVSGNSNGAAIGVAEGVRSRFDDATAAVEAVKATAKPLSSSSLKAAVMEPDGATTYALVINAPAATEKLSLKLNLSAYPIEAAGKNFSEKNDGKVAVYADTYKIVETATADTVLANADASFSATVKAGSVKQGDFVTAAVATQEVKDGSAAYNVSLKVNNADITVPFRMSLLTGYGLEGVKVMSGGSELASSYNKYTGRVEFQAAANGIYTVTYTGKVELKGVAVTGSKKTYSTLKEAISFVHSQPGAEVLETLEFVVFGKTMYLVEEGEVISFVGLHNHVKNINIVGGNETAELVIDAASGSLPSLPIAEKGMKITYSGITFDSEKTEGIKHFDYRGNADISLLGCTFKQAIANRGAYSNVVVDGCVFACKTYDDTFKGYCYYSVPIAGCNEITVRFTNNQVTENWGGINMDWSEGNIYVADNIFANIDCSKPAIQLSRARTMKIENNKFSNITNENVFRFYSDYGASKTEIINNEIDADYVFQSDRDGAINSLNDFTFAYNTITSTTDLENGHVANSTADDVKPHGYVIDTNLNTIK